MQRRGVFVGHMYAIMVLRMQIAMENYDLKHAKLGKNVLGMSNTAKTTCAFF